MTALGQLFGQHVPRNRYDDEGAPVGTYCICGGWEGDYFADGEAGPFDEHLAAVVLAWVGERQSDAEAAVARVRDLLRQSHLVTQNDVDWFEAVDADDIQAALDGPEHAQEAHNRPLTVQEVEKVPVAGCEHDWIDMDRRLHQEQPDRMCRNCRKIEARR